MTTSPDALAGWSTPSGVSGPHGEPPARSALALLPVRAGTLPVGSDETVAECGGRVLLVGDGTAEAAAGLRAQTHEVRAAEVGAFAPGAWASALAPLLDGEDLVVLPGSPDGRDLAPRLAYALGRPLWAGAVRATTGHASVARYGGRVLVEAPLAGPTVVTLQPGVATVPPYDGPPAAATMIELPLPDVRDAELVELVPPTAATMDLAEAPRVFAGGAGLRREAEFALLTEVAAKVDASMGATRIVVDDGWVPFSRQIGTTGVAIDPRLYVAFGISGAVQHLTGIGTPEHVISVNLDPSCPMMSIADLAVVADAPAVLHELARLLGVPTTAASTAASTTASTATDEEAAHA